MAGNFSQGSPGWLPSGEASLVEWLWFDTSQAEGHTMKWNGQALTSPWAASLAYGVSVYSE